MRSYLFCVVCMLHTAWAYGYPGSNGVGAFSYSDSSGRRLGGTYDLKDGQVVGSTGDFPVPFPDTAGQGFGYGYPGNYFFPTYFANLDNYLQESPPGLLSPPPVPRLQAFRPIRNFGPLSSLQPFVSYRPFSRRAFDSNTENQRLAFNAARQAFDLTSNMAGYFPYFDYRFQQFDDFPAFGGIPNMPNFQNSAFASSMVGPGFSHQVASISPDNPSQPNINKLNRHAASPKQGGFYSVSSKSYSSSSNVNGEEKTNRGAETVVNENGKVSKYEVHS